MPFEHFRKTVAQGLAQTGVVSGKVADDFLDELTLPPDPALGHLALPCFKFAKALRKSPQDIAQMLAGQVQIPHTGAQAAGPYVNFKIDAQYLFGQLANEISGKGAEYGTDTIGASKQIVIEFCSPNIAKKLAFHHIRSTLLGFTLSNIFEKLGYEVIRVNFVGDWGAQFARLLAAFSLWGDKEKLASTTAVAMAHLSEIYVRFHKELDHHPEWIDLSNQWLMRLEQSEPEATAVWKMVRQVSLGAMDHTLQRLGVHFDHIEGESTYVPELSALMETIKEKAQAKLSEGAWIVEVEGESTPALIQKRDGTTLYLTRDIAAALERRQRWNFENMFYIVSEQQRLHFNLLKGVLKKMGFVWSDSLEHVGFGTVLFGSEKMSTREGRVVLLDDVLDEAKSRAKQLCEAKNPELKNIDQVANQVGLAAVVFEQLSVHRTRDLEFSWDRALTFDGETGPYVQYSLVRCYSLLERAGIKTGETPRKKGTTEWPEGYVAAPEEEQLLVALSKLRGTLTSAAKDREPYYVTHFLLEVAKAFNRFYYRFPVIQAEGEKLKQLRLQLVSMSAQVFENGLGVLGIPCLTQM